MENNKNVTINCDCIVCPKACWVSSRRNYVQILYHYLILLWLYTPTARRVKTESNWIFFTAHAHLHLCKKKLCPPRIIKWKSLQCPLGTRCYQKFCYATFYQFLTRVAEQKLLKAKCPIWARMREWEEASLFWEQPVQHTSGAVRTAMYAAGAICKTNCLTAIPIGGRGVLLRKWGMFQHHQA